MTTRSNGPAERRAVEPLVYDPAGRVLALGATERAIPAGGGNRAVLETFVALVGACRGVRPNRLVEVRDSDLDALAGALDLEATDLRQQLASVLGLSPQVSTRLLSMLQQRRLFLRVAAAAAGVAAVGGLAAVGVDPTSAASDPGEVPSASAGETEVIAPTDVGAPPASDDQPEVDGPLTVDEEGVGLIPPVEVDADGTVLIPPASIEREPGSS